MMTTKTEIAGASLDGRTFAGVQNSASGEISSETLFHYHEEDGAVWAEYSGGAVVRGMLLGRRTSPDTVEFVYQQLNRAGDLRTGENVSTIEMLPDGRLRIYEHWRWTSGDRSSGDSVVEEVVSPSRPRPNGETIRFPEGRQECP